LSPELNGAVWSGAAPMQARRLHLPDQETKRPADIGMIFAMIRPNRKNGASIKRISSTPAVNFLAPVMFQHQIEHL
jgi:hypothetical protein